MDYLKLVHLRTLAELEFPTLKNVIYALYDVTLYLTLFVALALAVSFAVLSAKKSDKLDLFKKFALGVAIGYSLVIIAVFLTLGLVKDKGDIDYNFYNFIGFFAFLSLASVGGIIVGKYAPKAKKYYAVGSVVAAIAYAVVVLSFASNSLEPHSPVLFYLVSVLLILAIAAINVFAGKQEGTATDAKSAAYAGVTLALSFALSYVRLFRMPDGGSVTLASMLPLMIYSYVFGVRKGTYVCVAYGVLQFFQSPVPLHPMQIALDYPIAYSSIGLVGIAKKFKFLKGKVAAEIVVGIFIAGIFRYAAHVASGYFVYYNPSSEFGALGYSLIYNIIVIIDVAIDAAVAAALVSSKRIRSTIIEIN